MLAHYLLDQCRLMVTTDPNEKKCSPLGYPLTSLRTTPASPTQTTVPFVSFDLPPELKDTTTFCPISRDSQTSVAAVLGIAPSSYASSATIPEAITKPTIAITTRIPFNTFITGLLFWNQEDYSMVSYKHARNRSCPLVMDSETGLGFRI